MTVASSFFADPARARAELLVCAWLEADCGVAAAKRMTPEAVDRLTDRVAEVYREQLRRVPVVQRGPVQEPGETNAATTRHGCPRVIALSEKDTTDHRSPDCVQYASCLDYAVGKGWKGFSCRGCSGPARDGEVHSDEVLARHRKETTDADDF